MASGAPPLSGRRIQIVGVTGAGKSTFAKKLGEELSIPVCELDTLFHVSRAGGALPAGAARHTIQDLIDNNDEWIIDGNHWLQLKELSYRKATDILWVDTPLPLTLWRVFTRTLWEIIVIPGVLRRELSADSLIYMSMSTRAKKHKNWARKVQLDSRWKRIGGWFGRSRFLRRLKEQRRSR